MEYSDKKGKSEMTGISDLLSGFSTLVSAGYSIDRRLTVAAVIATITAIAMVAVIAVIPVAVVITPVRAIVGWSADHDRSGSRRIVGRRSYIGDRGDRHTDGDAKGDPVMR
jgi:hypothetical protein